MKSNKSVIRYTLFGSVLELLVVFFTGLLGMSEKFKGFRNSMRNYFLIWSNPDKFDAILAYVFMAFMSFTILLAIINIIALLAKKRFILILPTIGLFLSMAFLPFLYVMVKSSLHDVLGIEAAYVLSCGAAINLVVIFIFASANQGLLFSGASKKVEKEEKQVSPAKEVIEVGLKEEDVRKICEDYIELHKEELHKDKPTPIVEEVVDEEIIEEPIEVEEENEEVEEEVEVIDANGQIIKIKRKKKVPFESRLRRSEYDLRHKYYDLRDYIKWYGLNNRLSIPGDSFSYKRRKYFFVTIVGKHIKFYAALDSDKYENSPIPVEKATAKKYADTPCVLRIKSDLSYRRAKALVDEAMKEAGIAKPEGNEPKETQHLEKNK